MMTLLITGANVAADRWAAWILAASFDATALLVLIGLVWAAIRRRVAPHVGYGLFLLVPLKLLMPVFVTVPAGVVQWTPSALISASIIESHMPERHASKPPIEAHPAAVRADNGDFSLTRVNLSRGTFSIEQESPGEIQAGTGAGSRFVTETPRLSARAMFMLAWLVGVLLLVGRFVYAQLRFRARLRQCSSLDHVTLDLDLHGLCRLVGVTQAIRIVECEGIAAPAIWGIVRPTIILPRGITSALTADQLRWVLLHELAHIRHRDLIVLLFQRLAAILHFFNPAIWLANRLIDQLREYACDDSAVSLSHASAVAPGEAFVRVLQHAHRSHHGLRGALGVFGLDSRAACFLRVRRLLDTERPIRTGAGSDGSVGV